MSAPARLTPTSLDAAASAALYPRAQVIAQAWQELGDEVAPFSNGSGRPLARTMKLILDPLVIRPVQNPGLAGGSLTAAAADELRGRIRAASAELAAASAWFLELKAARRRLRITDGNPQEKYFQRCYELARTAGAPRGDADAVAVEVVSEIAQASGDSLLSQVRQLLRVEAEVARLDAELAVAWQKRTARPADASPDAEIAATLDACTRGEAAEPFAVLVGADAGTTAAGALDADGAAGALGLTLHPVPPQPTVGGSASKRDLPLPFDRSIFERLFAALSGGAAPELAVDAQGLVEEEILRSSRPWELGTEESRVVMVLGTDVSRALDSDEAPSTTSAHRQLAARWRREAYVRRALRLPAELSGVPASVVDDVRAVRRNYLRRLWVRLHGRELREQSIEPAGLWDLLDGVLRSVVMDQRQRLKIAMGRGSLPETGSEAA
ncbi:hypothetical protein [Microbacterium sp. PMB16]|uniref:hypothetical protein n=1 Tax=Microbacterium sp. PMB16 TaxID=3120157 RepID=UPI003F4C8761